MLTIYGVSIILCFIKILYGSRKPDTPLSFHNLIQANTQTLHTLKHTNSNLLLFLEALYIKYRKPVLNIELRASKELVIFS